MITISLCMIVKNEEDTLARCLDSVKDLVDEINIIDTGSTDRTKEIAKQYTPNVYDFKWVDDFSVARNYSFSKATKEYVMWLDADDILLEEDAAQFKKLKETLDPATDVVIMRYNLISQDLGTVVSYFYRERLVKRSCNFEWKEPVHECLNISGTTVRFEIAITHKKIHPPTRRNLDILEKYIQNGNELSTRNHYYFARELSNFGEFEKAIAHYELFLETDGAVLSNYLDACSDLSRYYLQEENQKMALKSLLRYFEKAGPRAEICCRIGDLYKNMKDYPKAITWYELAPHSNKPDTLGSLSLVFWDYVPYMELCSCYYHLGNIDKAIFYNEKAGEAYPENNKVCHNRVFLGAIKQQLAAKKEGAAEPVPPTTMSTTMPVDMPTILYTPKS